MWDQSLSLGYNNNNNNNPRFVQAYYWTSYCGDDGGAIGVLEKHNLVVLILRTNYSLGYRRIQSPFPMRFYPSKSSMTTFPSWNLVGVGPNIP